MTCPQQDSAHAYVAGTLRGEALEAFELHLLTCAECRDTVRLGDTVRAGLRASSGAGSSPGRLYRIGLLLAAAVVLAVLLRPETPLQELGRFAAPVFDGGAARADADSVSARVDRGMIAYKARDYHVAARELAEAQLRDSAPAVAFYLGVARAKIGDELGALLAFSGVRETRGNPYEADAGLLAAKVWLRLGKPDSALATLGSVSGDDGAAAARIRALQDSIRRAIR